MFTPSPKMSPITDLAFLPETADIGLGQRDRSAIRLIWSELL
jgi:hypothetical protein